RGIEMNVDFVQQHEQDMTDYELMLAESQERMLLVVKEGHEQDVIEVFKKHQVEAVTIGKVIENQSFRVIQNGEVFADVPVAALVEEAPVYDLPAEEATYFKEFQQKENAIQQVENHSDMLKTFLGRPTLASQTAIYNQLKTNAQDSTLIGPGASAAVVGIKGTEKAIAMRSEEHTSELQSRF